jgi:hypothetical protein
MKIRILLLCLITTSIFAMEEQFSYKQATENDTQPILNLINNITSLAQEYPWHS